MKIAITEVSIYPASDSPIYSARATKIALEDEGGGRFISITQDTDDYGTQCIRLDFAEIPHLVEAVRILQSGE